MLYLADSIAPGAIQNAAQLIVLGAAGLIWVAVSTLKDFSFLRATLRWGGFVAIMLIIACFYIQTHLGTWFDIAMIAHAGLRILYDTSNIFIATAKIDMWLRYYHCSHLLL